MLTLRRDTKILIFIFSFLFLDVSDGSVLRSSSLRRRHRSRSSRRRRRRRDVRTVPTFFRVSPKRSRRCSRDRTRELRMT